MSYDPSLTPPHIQESQSRVRESRQPPTTADQINYQQLAMHLTQRGGRIAIIEKMVPGAQGGGPSRQELEAMQSECGYKHVGRVQEYASNAIRRIDEAAEAAAAIMYYSSTEQRCGIEKAPTDVDPWLLCHTYDERVHLCAANSPLKSISILFLLIRDYSRSVIDLVKCRSCRTHHLHFTNKSPGARINQCPHCYFA